ncbi:glycosyltransferase [Christiangramia echinicola]|uniref:Glycosyltransferase involved in cell wall bisynthesis n=1 Tax=Christiangramia echinicola TaxID=279359 RepID=A0A1H1QR84_9FLAO|nr:glycosyltransferase [Christiangramia echinicola]SDS25409.1 Glycosyltransferase involved in cell wall bisynthesis [Christiangramia echinicola]
MKILQLVTKRQYRGAEVFAANLSKELIQLGHTIIFAGLYKNETNILEVEGARNIDLSKGKRVGFSWSLVRSLVKLIKQVDPDVIQCNGSDTLKYMIAASYIVKQKPIVYRNISTISEWLGSDIKLSVYKKIFSKVDHVTSVGSESIQDLINTLDYPKNKTSVIRRGIPNIKIDQTGNAEKLRNELGLTPNARVVMHVGNFSPEKNHVFLLDIFNELKDTNPDIKLVCVGDGITFETIQNKIKQRGLEDTVYLLGFRKDIPALLSAADCVVLSSLVEGVPGVILEAAVQGKPSIATNVGGVKEVLINNKTGFIIDDFDKPLFRTKITELCRNDELTRKLGESARELVIEEFNPQKNARKFENLYANLAGISIDKKDFPPTLKILQLIQKKQYRGAEIFCCQLSNELLEKGHEVLIYSVFDGSANLPFNGNVYTLDGNQNYRYGDYKGWKAISNIINNFKPDVIQANASDTLKYAVFSRMIFGWKTPIIFRNASLTSYYIHNTLSRSLNKFLFQRVNAIISVSESSREDLINLFPFTMDKSEVVTNGVSPIEQEEIENPYRPEDINIVHVGSLTPEKNHFELVRIFEKFLQLKKRGFLHIIGEGYLKKDIEAYIASKNLNHRIKLYGEKANPENYIKFAEILVLPSLIEGLPGVILEAMFYGTVVIAYDVGGVSELLNDNTGYLISKNDPDAFVKAMIQSLTDERFLKQENAKKIVHTQFNNRILVDQFLRIYYKTIDRFATS